METNERTAFWLVWSPRGGQPLHRHTTLEIAQDEAKRLAERHPGRHFYIMQCLGYEMVGAENPLGSTLPKGTLVHVGGIPVTLVDKARIKTANVGAVNEAAGVAQ